MLCDLQAMKPVAERDLDNFDPNDEVLLRYFTIPVLLDGLRTGTFDTGQGAKTDIILGWALGMHLEDEADKLTDEVFAGLVRLYTTRVREEIDNWWRHVPEAYKEENHVMLQQKESTLASTLNHWHGRREVVAVGSNKQT
jgi:hypothetical protein